MSKGGTLKFLSACRVMALYLTLFGYFGNVYSGTVLVNSNNAIKNLPGGGAKPSDAVSPSPGTSLSESIVQKAPVETLQPGACTEDDECGADEFCNDVRGACLPCRKSRKRCGRDSMCCAGNRCSNGVCQANDVLDPVTESVFLRRHNSTMEHHAKRPPPANGGPNQSVKGQEGDTCLRSSDCSEGFCCARHFWSRICKPVLSEGQVCTRHRRKGAHGLELFQRCDCGDGMACRPERGGGGGAAEREHVAPPAAAAGAGRTGARNLHTCQRR
ncbi:dickkopf-related protein 1-like [Gadus chalcogrammus]|uniref:dickkopf-related protein 1-like n=1 Tax=Gadus chalcogrammus TaxID=1042646 RepID=UPI0024C4C98A|nr:dickkopf-related protein 1-like [Gadus chalcogrammus]